MIKPVIKQYGYFLHINTVHWDVFLQTFLGVLAIAELFPIYVSDLRSYLKYFCKYNLSKIINMLSIFYFFIFFTYFS